MDAMEPVRGLRSRRIVSEQVGGVHQLEDELHGAGILEKGYNSRPGERTLKGYVE